MHRLLAALLVMMLGSLVQAASPTEQVLSLVPNDACVCLLVRNLRDHAREVSESPLIAEFRRTPLGKTLEGIPEVTKLQQFDRFLESQFRVGLSQVRDELLGDAFVFAYWPARDARPERGLFVTLARDTQMPAMLLTRINDTQLKSGELKSASEVQYRGMTYRRCVDRAGQVNFQFVRGGLVAISQDEMTLRDALDRLTEPSSSGWLIRRLEVLGVLDTFLTFWINPRALDEEMEAKAKTAEGGEAAFLKTLNRYWRATEDIALALRLDKAAHLELHLRFEKERFPPAGRKLLEQASGPSRFMSRVPSNVMLAVAGGVEPNLFLELLGEFGPEGATKKLIEEVSKNTQALLGLDLQKDVLDQLGSTWGFYAAAPPDGAAGWMPDLVLAVEAKPKGELRALETNWTGALRTLGGLVALGRTTDGRPTALRVEQQGPVTVVSVASTKDFPVGLQPAAAVKDSYLVFGSSPGAINRFAEHKPDGKPEVARQASPVIMISGRAIAAYLNSKERHNVIVAALAEAHAKDKVEVAQQLDTLVALIRLIDRIEVTQDRRGAQVLIRTNLYTKEPLRR